MRFRTVVDLAGKTATGFKVPTEVVESLQSGKRVPVTITINGYSYRTTVAVYAGVYMVPLSAEHRTKAGVSAGEEIEVGIELDREPRTVSIPEDLASALETASLEDRFKTLSYTNQKEHVRSIEDAKTPETRAKRIDKVLARLSE